MINFIMHEVRAGQQGAREDFEQMLGLLVQATHGDAHLVFANPGDWGIDVLTGNLNGRVTIWQAKYFIREFKDTQKSQVRDSFQSAIGHSARHGYTVDRWVLCVPLSLGRDPSGYHRPGYGDRHLLDHRRVLVALCPAPPTLGTITGRG